MTLRTDAVTTPSARGPATGLAVQFGLLAVLAATTGLTGAGLVAGAAYGIVLTTLLAAGLHRSGRRTPGPANLVTLGRAVLVGGVTALVLTSWQRPVPTPVLVTLVAVALALDGVDGQVARRTGTASVLGARFDMEVDAFLILVLSVYVAADLGWWTVAIGALRYVFVAAARVLPWLGAALPHRFSRKVVAALQGIVLVVATAHLLPYGPACAAVGVALAALTWSFGRDVVWLYRAGRARTGVAVPRQRRAPALVS